MDEQLICKGIVDFERMGSSDACSNFVVQFSTSVAAVSQRSLFCLSNATRSEDVV